MTQIALRDALRRTAARAVTDAGATFKSAALDTNDKFSFTFDKPGTYKYFCSIHPHMVGTIVVK